MEVKGRAINGLSPLYIGVDEGVCCPIGWVDMLRAGTENWAAQ